ncbi:ribosome biogenesis GTP-binding protein YihA/YsxC [Candidatus Viadribacter manganicus]|uniref:Probable GTP-binding protein EngB n=1 Tax=Candidatus Viadribacter manganicus TaxID=1759059 RepID=A0A1B1AF41_9PROT|nr:ribosome biogenesis GTP-binding protein YihA/YsxC [Candidatus Viadribacter manganicus]ANP45151.1 GTP-binding protein [Candidatus Viadribacter manganicus]
MTPEEEAERIEIGRLLFAGPIEFERGVAGMEHLPEANVPEIAFAGRSNVGKSSLINKLTGRNKLARASTEPGRTRELNFFRMGDKLRLVDLPGYGYAKAPKNEIGRWTTLTRDYLRGRVSLKRVILLIDGRHGLKPDDKDVMDALDKAAVTYQLVLTKADKVKPTEIAATAAATRAAIAIRPAAHPEIIATSSETGLGIERLRAEIAALA